MIKKWNIKDKLKDSKVRVQEKIDRIMKKSEQKMQSDEMLDLSSKLRMHKIKKHMRYIVGGAAALALLLSVMVYKQVRVYHGYKVLSSTERSDDAVTQYVRVKKNRILKCSPNGVTCVNNKNEVQWNTTFNMQSLIIDSCGSTVVVGDKRGSLVYVFDENGLLGHYEVEYTLVKVCVAKQGVVAAVLEDGETTWVNVYDAQGNILVKNKTSMMESGYPLDVALSSDGLKMAVSYLTADQENIKTQLAFYKFSSSGKGQADNLINQVTYSGQVVPEVYFMDDGRVVALADDGIIFFNGRQNMEETAYIQVEQEIISAFCDGEYVGIITASDEEISKHKYKMQIYSSNGKQTTIKYFDDDYTNVSAEDGEIILFNDSDIVIYTVHGKKKFSGTYEKALQDVTKGSGEKRYYVISRDTTEEIQIR